VVSVKDGETKTVVTEDGEYDCSAVIIACGMKHRPLPIPNFEDYVGKGISYCAVCDGVFFKGKNVAVAGGGNTALQDALYLSQYCAKVTLIHRRDEFRGDFALVEKLKAVPNVELMMNSNITALDADDALRGIVVTDKITGEEKKLAIDGLFCAVGQLPQNTPFKDLVELDESGFIKAGEDCTTNCKGIFAAGDCRTKEVRQLTTAAADGAVAALGAVNYIKK
jgi:thioredoxin reductase (NADPH)